jgi:hypothetical protein
VKTHTSAFKNTIKEYGREIDALITYELDGETIELGNEELNSITPSYESSILKSVMKQLIIDSNVDIPINTDIEFQFGVKTRDNNVLDYRNNYDYVTFGHYIVKEIEKKEDTQSYEIKCYDKMLYAMQDYEMLDITYPITIRSYINTIASKLGLVFKNSSDTFPNYDKEITQELFYSRETQIIEEEGQEPTETTIYTSLGYTYRDILDQLAQVTASTICINENDDELELRYINNIRGLPEEYQELEYIQSNGTQYIDTGMKLKQNSGVELKVSNITYGNTKLFGSRSSATSNNFSIISTSSSIVLDFQNYNNNRLTVSTPISEPITISMNNQKMQVNTSDKNIGTYSNFTTPGNAYIFNGSGSFASGYSSASMRLYYCKIYDNGTLARDFIPCYRKSDNIIGLYDLVNDTFYQKATGDNFTKGKEIGDVINDEYLKDINVNFGDKYGPINSIVLSRSAESDNVYIQDEVSVDTNGLCELKIIDNQIMNYEDRSDYLPDILNQLNGLEYHINDFSSTGICYYNLCDRYNIIIDNITYNCVMFNDEILITQGLEENIHTDMPEDSTTEYDKADKTDRKINKTYIMVNKQENTINSLVQTVSNQGNELNTLTNTVQETITSTEDRIEVIETQLVNGVENVRNNLVTIDINGINVSTNLSEIQTLMTNDKFVIKSGDTTLAYFGYDDDIGSTKAEMDNLTVTNYFVTGYHRIEKFDIDGEYHTGIFYIGE